MFVSICFTLEGRKLNGLWINSLIVKVYVKPKSAVSKLVFTQGPFLLVKVGEIATWISV